MKQESKNLSLNGLIGVGVFLLFISFFINFLALVVPIFVLNIYNKVIPNHSIATLYWLCSGVVLLLFIDLYLRIFRFTYIIDRQSNFIISSIYKIYDSLKRKNTKNYRLNRSLLLNLPKNLSSQNTTLVVIALLDAPFSLLFLFIIFYLNSTLGFIVLSTLILMSVGAFVYIKISSHLQNSAQKNQKRLDLLHKRVLRDAKIKSMDDENLQSSIDASLKSSLSFVSMINLFATLILLNSVVVTTVGALEILDLKIGIGELIAINMLSVRLFFPLLQLLYHKSTISYLNQTRKNLINLEKGDALLDRDKGVEVLEIRDFRYQFSSRFSARFKDISFKKGHIYSIIGANSIGKSTLLKALSKNLEVQKGSIFVDSDDINSISQNSYCSFAFEIRDYYDETILEYLKRDGVEKELIDETLKLFCIKDTIYLLESGVDTKIDKNSLSPSTLWLLELARVFLEKRAVIIIDDPTKYLDNSSSKAIIDALVKLSQDRVVIISTNKEEIIKESKFIVELKKGEYKIWSLDAKK